MRILFLSHYFPPEVNAPANRTHEHCREWVKAGHDVHVVTCVPSHPAGVAFPGYRVRWYQREQIDGITVHRVWTHFAANKGVLRRTLNYVSFVPSALWRAARLGPFDIIIGTSPQFFCAVAAWLAARLTGTPWVFELRDLWPESIIAVGATRRYMPLRLLERIELRMYRDARSVVCVSGGFIDNLESRGVERSKLALIPNGIDPAFWEAGSRATGRASLGAGDQDVIVSYVGTVGMAHNLGTVLDAAKRLRDRPDIKFVIVGDGAELPSLRNRAETEALTNVSFTGLVPRDRIPHYLAASDICLVTLKRSEVFEAVLPSKMFEAMAAARPILLAVDGEARQTLERAGAGLAVAPGDAGALTAGVLTLIDEPERRTEMGLAGARFVEREFSRRAWAGRYVEILEQVRSVRPFEPAGQPKEAPPLY